MTKQNLSRRELLKISSMSGALAGAGALGLRHLGPAEVQAAQAMQGQWTATCCNMCGDTHYNKYLTSGFTTPSGKFEFYSQQMLAKGLNPLPDYVPTEDLPSGTYPFHLINWKEALHTHSRTQNNRWLMEFHGENELWININRAKALGIGDGDMVTVENPYGKARARAKVTRRIHPDVVGMVHGFGHWALGPVALGKGINDSQFIRGQAERISGMAAHKDGAVKVYK